MTEDTYGVLLPFDSDDPVFARGFEAGHVWTTMRVCERDGHLLCSEEEGCAMTVHTANAEMVLRIAECTGHTVQSEEVGDGWMHALFKEEE